MTYTNLLILLAVFGGAGCVSLLYRWRMRRAVNIESFTTDLTEAARNGTLGPIIGMDDVIERVLHVLARKTKNNPLLIGEPGVGKTAVVEGLALRIVSGKAPEAFLHKRILSVNLLDMISGTKYRGELEARLQNMLQGLERHPRENIIFIDEVQMIEQTRGTEGALDIADVLKPAMSRGTLQIIAATTWDGYKEYLRPDAAIDRRFQPVLVAQPTRAMAIQILYGIKNSYEKFHHVCISDEAIELAVDLSLEFIKDRSLPDKALDVIDEACATVSIEAVHSMSAAPLGVLHKASSDARASCPTGVPVVTGAHVEEVVKQWKTALLN